MMRKLAVTVFAMSLTLIGCGSSSTSKKPDAASDTSTAADVGKDTVVVTSDTNNTLDTGVVDTKVADTAVTDVSIIDVAKPEVSGDVVPTPSDARDGSPSERVGDTLVKLDTNPDTKIVITDAPADTAPVSGDADIEVGGDAQAD
jgi:hypothetical protein